MHNREEIAKKAESWIGLNEKDGSFKQIIDLYNKGTRGYNVKYTDAWCATTVGALAIATGNTDIIPIDCSCGRMIEKAKAMGIWVENDAFVPQMGDIIMYDWQDNGKGDNTGWPDHTGIITAVNENKMTVVEGNKSEKVGTRKLAYNSKNIRGYITPKYEDAPVISTSSKASPVSVVEKTKKVKITAWSLYIRKGPGKENAAIGTYKKNEIVNILEEKNGWGRTNRGWISLKWTT
jgi:CHAP domain./Bacterial SH3 domain.